MNRLILLGNGFDLAHGLATSYNDFILWYLKECFNEASEKNSYVDALIKIDKVYESPFPLGQIKTVSELLDYFYDKGFNTGLLSERFKLQNYANNWVNPFKAILSPGFFSSLVLNCSSLNWVDIENVYYLHLKGILKNGSDHKVEVGKLNREMSTLVFNLERYLTTLRLPRPHPGYTDILNSQIDEKEFNLGGLNLEMFAGPGNVYDYRLAKVPKNTYIVNFNYTNTIEQYIKDRPLNATVNYIHGQLNHNENRLIFGFGDELDDEYKSIEGVKTKGFLEYIKSFWYLKTTNYHDLIRFIDSDKYQVYILGHSCGLSDRTMLNMIFEHGNCMSIKIYYYVDANGKSNFTDLTQDISRHFKDKGMFRKKTVNLRYSKPMPQVVEKIIH